MKNENSQAGFLLMEVIVSLSVVMVLVIGIYNLILLYLQLSNDNKMYVVAIELVNQKMEQIRNMPYDDIGVVGGMPSGIIPQEETVARNGYFTINNYVVYYDDPADGEAGSSTPDTIPTDYKIVTVKVSWQAKYKKKNVTVFSKIIPRTVETDQGYGLLKISVRNSYAQPVPNASVRVENNAVSPAVDVVNLTNAQGILYLPATSSAESFQITVTKTDEEPAVYWGRDQTYATSSGKTPFHLTVTKGNMTEKEFQIDKLATLHLRTLATNLPENFQVNSVKSGMNEKNPRLAADSSDSLYYAWTAENSTSSKVYIAKYDSSGSRIWASDKTVYSTIHQENPDISAAASGDIYVAWQDNSVTLKAVTLAPGGTKYAHGGAKQTGKAEKIPGRLPGIFRIFGEQAKNSAERLAAAYKKRAMAMPAMLSGAREKIKHALSRAERWKRIAWRQLSGLFDIKDSAASATIIQAIKVSGTVINNSSVTLAFDNPPTAGNLMIAIAIHENSNRSFTSASNAAGPFTESIVSDVAFGLDVGIWHKVAGAGEPSSVTVSANGNLEGGVMMLMEVAGIDTADPLNEIKPGNQTSGSSRTATTGLSPVSTANGFAVAAISFADNDFNDPTTASWTSGSADPWTQQNWTEINGDDDSSIGIATADITSAAAQSATLTVTGGGSGEERNSVLAIYNLYDPDDARVAAGGTQSADLLSPSSAQYAGGYFAISDLTGSHDIISIKVSETGSIDAQNDLDNIKLFYELDTAAPYDCEGESYGGSETQFGATDTDGFSGPDGSVQMNGAVAINTAQTMCVYVVMDVGLGAEKDQTIELEITNPSTDVAMTAGTVIPATPAAISGLTAVAKPAEFHQAAYRWRDDDGDEDEAGWLGGLNSPIIIRIGGKARLRFLVDNQGSLAGNEAFRLEYAEKTAECSSLGAGAWTALPANESGDWRSTSSPYYSDGDATTQQLGGGMFQAGEMKADSNQTGNISVGGDTNMEVEYSLAPTSNAGDLTYCFRLSKSGTALDDYDVYAEASISGDYNIYLMRLNPAGNQVWPPVRVNNNDSAANQTNPRIALAESGGIATTVVVWLDDRLGQNDVYAQAFDESGNALWNGGNEVAVTSSTTEETQAVVAIDSNGEAIFAWTENGLSNKIYLIKYDLSGNPLWTAPIAVPSTGFSIDSPSLEADTGGNFYLAYTETILGNRSSYACKYDGSGMKMWDTAVNVDSDSGERYDPVLALHSADLYAAWADERNGKQDVYSQKFDLSGNASWPRDQIVNITVTLSSSTKPAMEASFSGKPFASWTDSRNALLAVYSAEVTAPAGITPVANVPLRLWGSNTISEIPVIYEYDLNIVTNGSGEADLRVEADSGGYQLATSATASVSVILLDPPAQTPVLPAQDIIWNIYVE